MMLFTMRPRFVLAVCVAAAAAAAPLLAQRAATVSAEDLRQGLADPGKWLMFGGSYDGQRHSPLTQLTPDNVAGLTPQWTFQTDTLGRFETTTLLLDNVLYVTGPQNVAFALDAHTGRQIWRYRRELPSEGLTACCGLVNKGFGALGDQLFMTTLDAHVIALDMRTGDVVWDTVMEDYRKGYASTIAPLVVNNKVIVGVAGGEYGIRGFVDAYDVETGARAWRFYTVPGPGEPGSETWAGDSWERGGAAVWTTGTYDSEQNLVFFGTGNPSPDYHSASRKGDNLYATSLIALDADTGALRWHYQFTPHDVHDWDSTHVPVLTDLTIDGQLRKVVMVANRNGFFYTIDRTNGRLILGTPYVETTWAKEIGADGRPIELPNHMPDEKGTVTCPDLAGGTNFMPPSYDPGLQLFFVTARETCATYFAWEPTYAAGDSFTGGATARAPGSDAPWGALRALDPRTGERRWEFRYPTPSWSGVLSTASGVVFTGDAQGNFYALDSRTGEMKYHYQLGSNLHGTSPTTYMMDGKQIVLVPAGTNLTAFALP